MIAALLLPLAFVVGVAAIALQVHLVPPLPPGESYVIMGPGLVVLGVLAAMLVTARIATVPRAVATMAACIPAVAIYHIVVEVSGDPTAHNLWPLELVFGLVVGLGPVLAGALLGVMLRRLFDAPR
jgi:hypothetical protein